MAEAWNPVIDAGADFAFQIVVDNGGTPPVPVNLTGYKVRLQIRQHQQSSEPAISMEIGSGFTIPVGSDGRIVGRITAAQSADLAGQYAWDCEIEEPTGSPPVITRIFSGNPTFKPRVTR